MYRNMGPTSHISLHLVTLTRDWTTTFLTCNKSRKYWSPDRSVGRSFHCPGTPAAKYYAQLNAERHYTTSLAKTWTTIGRLDPTAGGRNEVPDHKKLASAWVTTVAVELRPLAGEHRRFCAGWQEGDAGLLLRLDTGWHCHFGRTSDVISHSWIPQHTQSRFQSATISVKG
jgi:hypothetical protein